MIKVKQPTFWQSILQLSATLLMALAAFSAHAATVAADRALSPLASVVAERFRNDAALLLKRFVPET